MQKTVVFLAMLYLIAGCRKGSSDVPLIYPTAHIHYVDTNWHDLITNGSNGYIFDSIRAYDYQNGVKTKLSSPSNIYPNGFSEYVIYPKSGIEIGSWNNDIVNRYTVTIIHLKMGVDDTLRLHLTGSAPVESSHFDSIWYNSLLIKTDTFSVMKRY